jgi:protein tyrosine/serine phosphatase
MRIFVFASVVLFAFFFVMTKKTETKKEDLPNFHEVNKNLFRGGQPTEEGIKQLSARGIKTVISFRDTQEKVLREKKIVEANGMRFVNMRLNNWFKSSNHEIDAIIEEIRKPENRPVFIHCKRGADRTGTVVAIYRMKYDGWTAKQANAEAKKFGLGWWQVFMKDFIHDYYRDNIEKK